MPHQCVRCGSLYKDTSSEILNGCACGGKLFFYIKQERLEQLKESTVSLTSSEKKQIEKDVYDIIGQQDVDQPVVLDLESIRVLKPGKYELDLIHLFKKQPLVYKLAEGKYIIDLPETFKQEKDN
ncbi:MAG: Zn-ribbon containing protein [Candidatus Woesearchaeota archaeon]